MEYICLEVTRTSELKGQNTIYCPKTFTLFISKEFNSHGLLKYKEDNQPTVDQIAKTTKTIQDLINGQAQIREKLLESSLNVQN